MKTLFAEPTRIPVAVAIATILLASSAFAEDVSSKAKIAFKAGVEAFNAEKVEEALEHFLEADELAPSWRLKYNIGQCQAALKKYGLAIRSFEAYLAGGGDEVPAERRDEVLAELDRLRKMTGTVSITAPEGAVVFVDGDERGVAPLSGKLRLLAGVEHQVVVKRGDDLLLNRAVHVGGGESIELTVTGERAAEESASNAPAAEPAEPDVSTPTESDGFPALFWVGTALTVAVAGTGIGFGVAGNKRHEDFSQFNDEVAAGTRPADDSKLLDARDDVKTYDGAATGMFIGAGVLAAATTVILIVHLTGDDQTSDDNEVAAAPGGLAVSF